MLNLQNSVERKGLSSKEAASYDMPLMRGELKGNPRNSNSNESSNIYICQLFN